MRDRWRSSCLAIATMLVGAAGLGSATAAADSCPNATLRIGAGAALPQCRAYERVSPANKQGGAVEGFQGLLLSADDGSGATFFNQNGTGVPAGGGAAQDLGIFYSGRRGEEWSTQRLSPPQPVADKTNFLGMTRNLRFAFVEGKKFGAGPTSGRGLYMIDTATESITTLVPNAANRLGAPNYPGSVSLSGQYSIDGASDDGARVIFETRAPLATGAAEEADNVFIWQRSTNSVTLAGVLPSGLAPATGSFGGAYSWFNEVINREGPEFGGAFAGNAVQAINATDPTATKVFFTVSGAGQIYLRSGLDTDNPQTVRVSRAEPGVTDPNGELPAIFQEATPTGSRAFFTSAQKLTEDATTGPGDEGRDLYMWDASSDTLTDIAPDLTGANPLGAQVRGVLGVSDDGTTGYFAALGALTSDAVAGQVNLYRFDTTTTPVSLHLVAVLDSTDSLNWSPRSTTEVPYVTAESLARTARVTPDGHTLLFSSVKPLTGYPNRPVGKSTECNEDSEGLRACAELFRYTFNSSGSNLFCLSCSSLQTRPIGSALLQSDEITGGAVLPEATPIATFAQNLSDDGNTVFFESPDSLVPSDTNGVGGCPSYVEQAGTRLSPNCQDVYEWRADSSEPCSVPLAGGCINLLSTGQSPSASYFTGASSDGSVAFIVTASQLVPTDLDGANDLYGVRIAGGLASQFTVPAPSCSSEDCQGPTQAAPPQANSGSATVRGFQNAKRCVKKSKARHKGNARRKGRRARKHCGATKHRSRKHGRNRAGDHRSSGRERQRDPKVGRKGSRR